MKSERSTTDLTLLKDPSRNAMKRLLALLVVTGASQGFAQIPSNPDVGCSVSAPTVNGWFKSGTATLEWPRESRQQHLISQFTELQLL